MGAILDENIIAALTAKADKRVQALQKPAEPDPMVEAQMARADARLQMLSAHTPTPGTGAAQQVIAPQAVTPEQGQAQWLKTAAGLPGTGSAPGSMAALGAPLAYTGEAIASSTARLGANIQQAVGSFGRSAEQMRDVALRVTGSTPLAPPVELSAQIAPPPTPETMPGAIVGSTAAYAVPFAGGAKIAGMASRALGLGAETTGFAQAAAGGAAASYAGTGEPAEAAKGAALGALIHGIFLRAPQVIRAIREAPAKAAARAAEAASPTRIVRGGRLSEAALRPAEVAELKSAGYDPRNTWFVERADGTLDMLPGTDGAVKSFLARSPRQIVGAPSLAAPKSAAYRFGQKLRQLALGETGAVPAENIRAGAKAIAREVMGGAERAGVPAAQESGAAEAAAQAAVAAVTPTVPEALPAAPPSAAPPAAPEAAPVPQAEAPPAHAPSAPEAPDAMGLARQLIADGARDIDEVASTVADKFGASDAAAIERDALIEMVRQNEGDAAASLVGMLNPEPKQGQTFRQKTIDTHATPEEVTVRVGRKVSPALAKRIEAAGGKVEHHEGWGDYITVPTERVGQLTAPLQAPSAPQVPSSEAVAQAKGEPSGQVPQAAESAGAPPDKVADAQRQWREKGTDSPYFKAWFGESKVVDEQGKPLVVYHGTLRQFEQFSANMMGRNTQAADTLQGSAFFFSDKPYMPNEFASMYGGNLIPAYLSLKNPLVVDLPKMTPNNIAYEIIRAKEEGHDGLIVSRTPGFKGGMIETGTFHIAFSPEQIKSATGNRGTFDAGSANILYAGIPLPTAAQLKLVAHTAAKLAGRVVHGPQDSPDIRTAAEDIVRQYHHGSEGEIAQRAAEVNSIIEPTDGWRGKLNAIGKSIGAGVRLSKQDRSDMIFYIDSGAMTGNLKPSATAGNLFKPGDTTQAMVARMSPAAKAAAVRMSDHMTAVHQEASDMLKRAGIDRGDPQFLEDYISHFYEATPEQRAAMARAFRVNNPLDKRRFYESYQAAHEATQGRLKPRFETVDELVRLHDAFNIRAAYGLKLVNDLKALEATTNMPLVLTMQEANEAGLSHWPQSTHWVWRSLREKPIGVLQGKASETEWAVRVKPQHRTGNRFRIRYFTNEQDARAFLAGMKPKEVAGTTVAPQDFYEVAEERARGTEIVRKGPVDVRVHPAAWDYFQSVFGKPWQTTAGGAEGAWAHLLNASATLNRFVKRLNTTLTPFHAIELGISGIATEKAGYLATPIHVVKLLRAGTKLNDPQWLRDAVGHGLVVDLPKDVQGGINWLSKAASGQFRKGHYARGGLLWLGNAPFKVGDWLTWKTIYAREKVVAYENLVAQLRKAVEAGQKKGKYAGWDEDKIKREAADMTNNNLGGLNFKTLARLWQNDPKGQQLAQAVAYAWDWTYSTLRQGGSAFQTGPKGKVARAFWARIIVGLGALYQFLNYRNTKRDFGEGRFTWENPDPGTAAKIYMGQDETGRSSYISIGKQLPEFIRWFTNTVGQGFSKLAVGPRLTAEQAFGYRPQFGIPDVITGKKWEGYPVEPGANFEPFELPGSRLSSVMKALMPFVLKTETSFAGSFPKSAGMGAGRAAYEMRRAWEMYAVDGDENAFHKNVQQVAAAMKANNLAGNVSVGKKSMWGVEEIPRALFLAEKGRTAAVATFAKDFWSTLSRRGKDAAKPLAERLIRLGWTRENALKALPGKMQYGRLREYKGKIVLHDKAIDAADLREAIMWFPPPE